MRWSVCVLCVLGITAVSVTARRMPTWADDQVSTIPDTVPNRSSGVSGPLMQAKLVMSQRVLEGLLNHDFASIQSSAQGLSQLAESFSARHAEQDDDQVYEHFRTEFVRLALQLESLAESQNLEGAAYAHQNLTATCIACHTHLRDGPSP